MIGIKSHYVIGANVVVTNSAVLVTTGLTSPIAALERQSIRFVVPFSVGATGGIRAQVLVPAGGTLFLAAITVVNTVTPGILGAVQNASAAFTNALAVAGSHILYIDVTVINGATAGNVDLQIAQNTADALSLTAFAGGYADVTIG